MPIYRQQCNCLAEKQTMNIITNLMITCSYQIDSIPTVISFPDTLKKDKYHWVLFCNIEPRRVKNGFATHIMHNVLKEKK